MKKIVFVIISLFSFINITYAFNIDIDKVDLNSKDNNVINNLNNIYKINTNNFKNISNNDESINDIVKTLVDISLSNDKDNKLKQLNSYLYTGDGTSALTGNLFVTDFVNKINDNTYSYDYIKSIRTVDMEKGILVYVYIDNVKVNDEYKDMILTYWLYDTNYGYKLHFAWFSFDETMKEYFNEISNNEIDSKVLNKSFNSNGFDISNDVTEDELNNIFNNNKLSNVSVTGMKDNGIDNYGSGFYIRSGVIATSWELFIKLLNNKDFIYVNDSEGNSYTVDGVIAADTEYDIVILKLNKDEGKGVTFSNSNDLNSNDNIFMINSFDNNGFSIKYGRYLKNQDGKLNNLLAINSSSIGACLYNKDGNVIGFNTGTLLDSELSIANSSDYLIELSNKLNNMSFDKISYTSLSDFTSNYFNRTVNEKEYNNIPDNIWEIYGDIGNIKNSISLDLIKGSYDSDTLSLRYKNDISDSISSMYLINSFQDELINQGFELIMDTNNKKIYKSNNYRVVIKSNMNYLIIIIMEI